MRDFTVDTPDRFSGEYVHNLVLNSYGINQCRVAPFAANFKSIAAKIFVNKVCFFGDITVNLRAFYAKNPRTFNNAFSSNFWAMFLGNPQLMLASDFAPSGFSGSTEVLSYQNILFDDLTFGHVNSSARPPQWMQNADIGSVTGVFPPPILLSISRLAPGTNVSPDVSSTYWNTQLATNLFFNVAAEYFYFTGYLASLNI